METPKQHKEGKALTPRVAFNALQKLGITLTPEDCHQVSLFAGRGNSYQPPTPVRKLNAAEFPTADRYRGFCRVQ